MTWMTCSAPTRTSTLRWRTVPPVPPPLRKQGGQKAAIATAHTLIVIIWHVLAETTTYRDLGWDYFTRRIDNPEARKRRLVRELEALGHKVAIEPTSHSRSPILITDQPCLSAGSPTPASRTCLVTIVTSQTLPEPAGTNPTDPTPRST
jgi:hypothetical protein